MLRLPSLNAEPPETRFPLSGRSAVFVLDASAANSAAPLVNALRSDPLLLWWAILASRDREAILDPLPTLESLADWLREHAALWRGVESEAVQPEQLDRWSQAAAEAQLVAELAGASATPDDRSSVEMLAQLCCAATQLSQWSQVHWPWEWSQLAQQHARLAQAVNAARDALAAGRQRPGQAPLKPKQLRRRRRELAAQWNALPGPQSFPQLMERLQSPAPAEPLSGDYQQRLEQEKLAALAEFAAGAGHEINNPIATIAGRAQLLLRHESQPERRRDLATIHRQAMRVHEMIADLMLFARPPDPNPDWFDLTGLLDELTSGLQPQCEQQDAQLRIVPADRALWVRADRTQLAVALRALCDNGLEAAGPQAMLEIRTRFTPESANGADADAGHAPARGSQPHALQAPHFSGLALAGGTAGTSGDVEAGWLELEVRDNGPGISAEVRRHLFDPFFSGREAGRGLGVGLSKCWRIARMHGGSIEVDSPPPRGCTFTLRLPVAATASPVLQSPA